jgi:prepilin-type N-terminal cleavage/methylation domain-containing protein
VRAARGFSLVELTISLALLAMLCVGLVRLVETALDAQATADDRSALWAEGLVAMDRMTAAVRRATVVHFPNAKKPSRAMLAVSGAVDDDGDTYFGDAAFPRADEDLWADMTLDDYPGIRGYDDDGDGFVDEPPLLILIAARDDDEDGLCDEDPWDGIDNDGDGDIDEDVHWDMNGDGSAGIALVDDDGDGALDEQLLSGSLSDDDEDGQYMEDPLNPVVFSRNAATSVLEEALPATGVSGVVVAQVTAFNVTYLPPTTTRGPLVSIALVLTSAAGETISLSEVVYPRNVQQRAGRRLK